MHDTCFLETIEPPPPLFDLPDEPLLLHPPPDFDISSQLKRTSATV